MQSAAGPRRPGSACGLNSAPGPLPSRAPLHGRPEPFLRVERNPSTPRNRRDRSGSSGNGCIIHAGAIIKSGAILGDRVVVHPYAIVGGDPRSSVSIGDADGFKVGAGTVVREFATKTLNREGLPHEPWGPTAC